MKIFRNQTKIERNKKISQAVLFLSLAILLIGFVWSITNPDSMQITLSYFLIAVAYILVQISLYMANKWGRSPRPDEIIENSLKGLNDQFTLYNYVTPVPHLLVGPAGIWIIKPYHHSGEITYNPDKKQFEQHGGPNFLAKWFAQESLPNIIEDSKSQLKKLDKYLQEQKITENIKLSVVNVFFSDKADVKVKNAPEITIHSNKLKDTIRQQAKSINIPADILVRIREKLPQDNR